MNEDVKDLIQQGHAIIRIENDVQQQISVLRPRNEKSVLQAILMEMQIEPSVAEKYFYSLPFKNKDGSTTYVVGLSIKAAMAIQRRWGNCASACRIVDEVLDR